MPSVKAYIPDLLKFFIVFMLDFIVVTASWLRKWTYIETYAVSHPVPVLLHFVLDVLYSNLKSHSASSSNAWNLSNNETLEKEAV